MMMKVRVDVRPLPDTTLRSVVSLATLNAMLTLCEPLSSYHDRDHSPPRSQYETILDVDVDNRAKSREFGAKPRYKLSLQLPRQLQITYI